MSFRPFDGLNFGTREAGMLIVAPVAGLRPSRALRFATLKVPKSGMRTSLPSFIALRMCPSTASTATVALSLVSSASLATASIKSFLLISFPSFAFGNCDLGEFGRKVGVPRVLLKPQQCVREAPNRRPRQGGKGANLPEKPGEMEGAACT